MLILGNLNIDANEFVVYLFKLLKTIKWVKIICL